MTIVSLEVKNLVKKYNDVFILNDVSASFIQSSVNLIIGPSGAGKSVFLKCLLGLEKPDSGEIKFLDIDEKEQKKRIGILFQKPVLYKEKTVFENVKFNLDLYLKDLNIKNPNDTILETLKQVGLEGCEDQYPVDLSGGMQKKLGLAMAIVYKPQYLFCDEPDSALDPESTKIIIQTIRKITTENKITTIVVSHNLETVINAGNNIVFLDKIKKKPLTVQDEGSKVFWSGNSSDLKNVENKRLGKFLNSNVLWKEYKKFFSKTQKEK